MDTDLNMNTSSDANAFGEYPVTSSTKANDSIPTTFDAMPTSTEDFSQIQTSSNEMDFNTQINTTNEFTDFQATTTNVENTEGEFANVDVLQQTGTASTDLQFGEYPATTSTSNADFSAQIETTTTDAQIDLGGASSGFEANAFTGEATTDLGTTDILQASSTAENVNIGEYQATNYSTNADSSSPIIDTYESAQMTQGADFNVDMAQTEQTNINLGDLTTSTPAFETNNFDFTLSRK